MREKYEEAFEAFGEVFDTSEKMGAKEFVATSCFGLGRIEEVNLNNLKARKLGGKSFKLYEEIGHHRVKEVEEWLEQLGD